jgi:hypothetical protein
MGLIAILGIQLLLLGAQLACFAIGYVEVSMFLGVAQLPFLIHHSLSLME